MAEKIDVFPYDANVKIEISGGFYTRLVELSIFFSKEASIQDLVQTLEEMKTREPKNEYEYHLLTVLTLISTIEKQAYKEKVIEAREVKTDDTQETDLEN